jgi:hypothetical protein
MAMRMELDGSERRDKYAFQDCTSAFIEPAVNSTSVDRVRPECPSRRCRSVSYFTNPTPLSISICEVTHRLSRVRHNHVFPVLCWLQNSVTNLVSVPPREF